MPVRCIQLTADLWPLPHKLANPELTVIDVMGDGDCTVIGAITSYRCRRNIDITAVIMNNNLYGMTGGKHLHQLLCAYATTAPYGVLDVPFDICKLAVGAGASYGQERRCSPVTC